MASLALRAEVLEAIKAYDKTGGAGLKGTHPKYPLKWKTGAIEEIAVKERSDSARHCSNTQALKSTQPSQ